MIFLAKSNSASDFFITVLFDASLEFIEEKLNSRR